MVRSRLWPGHPFPSESDSVKPTRYCVPWLATAAETTRIGLLEPLFTVELALAILS